MSILIVGSQHVKKL